MFKRFSAYDLIIVAVMSAIGLAIKPVVTAAVHIVSAPLMIPGGSLAGGFYMLWIVLAFAVTGKYGTATMVGVVQAIIVIISGLPGSHGILSLFSYVAPGLVTDLFLMLMLSALKLEYNRMVSFFACMCANLTGALIVNVIFFRLPLAFLALTLVISAISGGIGGLIAWELYRIMKRFRLADR